MIQNRKKRSKIEIKKNLFQVFENIALTKNSDKVLKV
jgi:hypothetical protein